jgi:3-oxoacyl-[acyl-carrier protein] reductase
MPSQENQPVGRDTSLSTTPLKGKTAIVTGASSGIGRAISLCFADLGSKLLLVARNKRALTAVQQQIANNGGSAEVFSCDLAAPAEIALLSTSISNSGGCDILINSAGIGRIGTPLYEMSEKDFDAIFATNLRAPFLLMRSVVPHMIHRGGGDIINISSLAGQNPLPNGAAYSASKWALNGLTYSAAEELRAHNIRVSVVAPGSVNTAFSGSGPGSVGSGSGPAGEGIRREFARRRKMLQPEDVASVVALLVTQPPQSFISEVRMRPTQKP